VLQSSEEVTPPVQVGWLAVEDVATAELLYRMSLAARHDSPA